MGGTEMELRCQFCGGSLPSVFNYCPSRSGGEACHNDEHLDVPQEKSAERRRLDFRIELESLINRHSVENGSDTPDYLLAQFLAGCLAAYEATVMKRDDWYGFKGLGRRLEGASV